MPLGSPGAEGAVIPQVVGLSRVRRLTGLGLAVLLPAAFTAVLVWLGSGVGIAGDALALLISVIVTSLVGGLWPAVVSALLGSSLLNFFFIPPVHTFEIREPHNIWTVVGFLLVGILVSAVVHRAATMTSEAARATAEARTLSAVAGATLRGEDALPTLLEQSRASFGMTSASLLRRPDHGGSWSVVGTSGREAPVDPAHADVEVAAGDDLVIAMTGRMLGTGDRHVLDAFAAQARALLERDELARAAAEADRLAAGARLRDALLAAIGHDLRTPLASARAAVTSLASRDVTWSRDERAELLATAEESLTRLSTILSDLLDLSRLRAGVLAMAREPIWLDELVPPALDELGPEAASVVIALPEDLPPALGDGALVMRALVNVIGNALQHGGSPAPVTVTGSAAGDWVELHVVDHGRGLPISERERAFQPFQRLGDFDSRTGLGLGLALSRGLVEAMGGSVEPRDTADGGLTMVLRLPLASVEGSAP